jgi:phosphoribosylanthranilate isomerase
MVAATTSRFKRPAQRHTAAALHVRQRRASILSVTQRTRIKICGIRRPEDALAAARGGADAIGLVFHPAAPRNITVEEARKILAVIPAFVTPVALFVDADPGFLCQTVRGLHLRHVQLHGDESPQYVAQLRDFAVIKAVRVDPARFAETLSNWRHAVAADGLTHLKGLVLETAGAKQSGGTGVANDWKTVRDSQRRGHFAGLPPLIAAGGLRPESVGDVVRNVRPWAVDVSSGVEESLGKKSPERIAAFVAAVREADAVNASR